MRSLTGFALAASVTALSACSSGRDNVELGRLEAPSFSKDPIIHAQRPSPVAVPRSREAAIRSRGLASKFSEEGRNVSGFDDEHGFTGRCARIDDRFNGSSHLGRFINDGRGRVGFKILGGSKIARGNLKGAGVGLQLKLSIDNDLSLSRKPLEGYRVNKLCYGTNFTGVLPSTVFELGRIHAPNGALDNAKDAFDGFVQKFE